MTGVNVYETANAILARKGRTFYGARHLLNPTHAARATRLYRFCRQIDDTVDESQAPLQASIALASVRLVITSGISHDPHVIDFIILMRECQIDQAIPLDLVNGVESDLNGVRICDEPELLRCCYNVAGTVGLMMAATLDVEDGAALPHAISLGIAMLLTNICRDISDDARASRRYVPASSIGNREPAKLICPETSLRPVICDGVARMLDLADPHYSSAEIGIACLPRNARLSICVAPQIYRGIGVKLRPKNLDYWSSRTIVSGYEKLSITLRTVLIAVISPPFQPVIYRHNLASHNASTVPESHSQTLGQRRAR